MDITHAFSIIDDPRCQCDIRYSLGEILSLVVCALLCSLQTLDEIVWYGESHFDFLQEHFGLHAVPSAPTLSRVLALIDPEQFGMAAVNFMRDQIGLASEIVAIDGKAIRSTHHSQKKSKLHILTALLVDNGVTLGSLAVPEKTNEIPAAQELIQSLQLKGKIVTADALNTQKETVKAILKQGADYCLPVKENHKTFYEGIRFYLLDLILRGSRKEKQEHLDYDYSLEKNRNRCELRECWVLRDWEPFEGASDWEGLNRLFVLRRTVSVGGQKQVGAWNFYISSLEASPLRFIEIVRAHWKIESLHWWIDVVGNEDACQFGTQEAQKTLNHLRKLVFALHKTYRDQHPKAKNMKLNSKKALLNDQLLLEILSV